MKLLIHFHVSGMRLQGMACSEGDCLSKLETIKDQKSGFFFSIILFRKSQITENNVSQRGHQTRGRQDGGFEAFLWTSSDTSEPMSIAGGRAQGPARHRGTGRPWAMAL